MRATLRENRCGLRYRKSALARGLRHGLTLIELLVVFCVISILVATLLPAVDKVRRQARAVVGVGNLRQITAAVDCFASDNAGRYPPSVATIGLGDNWNWQPPTMLAGYLKRTPSVHRSVSAYLHAYIEDGSVMFCPNAPQRYAYLQQAWDAGDEWDNPDTPSKPDALLGAYCLYWNYVGWLSDTDLFRGPTGQAGGLGESRIVVTDYFGYGHWRSINAYGSCEKLPEAGVTEGTGISSAYWSRPGAGDPSELRQFAIKLHAAYTDGHVESYCPADAVPMDVILYRDTREPYPAGEGSPGTFYLPRVGLASSSR
jgi:type II secretory pathway pseudopilin PulG